MKWFVGVPVFIGICVISLAGCSTTSGSNTTNKWVDNKTVNPSSLPSAVVQFVDQAGAKVGDPHPKIMSIKTYTDVSLKPGYRIEISGAFTYGTDHAHELQMIVLRDGSAGAFTDPYDNTFNKIQLNIPSPAS